MFQFIGQTMKGIGKIYRKMPRTTDVGIPLNHETMRFISHQKMTEVEDKKFPRTRLTFPPPPRMAAINARDAPQTISVQCFADILTCATCI